MGYVTLRAWKTRHEMLLADLDKAEARIKELEMVIELRDLVLKSRDRTIRRLDYENARLRSGLVAEADIDIIGM